MFNIAFIGAGKMAEALMRRLGPAKITASDIDPVRLKYLERKYKIKPAKTNRQAATSAAVIILAVKPQDMAPVLREISKATLQNKLVISIAAGIPLKYLQKKLPALSVIRAMPNNPALVGEGITVLAKGKRVAPKQQRVASSIFGAVGEVIWVEDNLMDAVTGLSGSGPAFVYRVLEGLVKGGMAAGLSKAVATRLALQTVIGAAQTAKRSKFSPQKLISMVASPGGTTVEGLKILKKHKAEAVLAKAVVAAAKKSKILSKRWAKN